ncbi:MAG: UDP-N-acetylmuramoyl-L-alanyl-D-glutamate--2,6-diaminopimelate ligase [Lachnospiraceae bacterium]|nr:UDP-N-acetylmuramoyl-L-alanyl-D-glutamate--2,6-diaminopimelate ligase [Lachnospiraceae bacterium]
MLLKDLLDNLNYECLRGSVDCTVGAVRNDSRKVEAGDLFICVSGMKKDGHDFIMSVIKKGVRALVVERDIADSASDIFAVHGVTVIKVSCTRYAMAQIAANYYRHPAKELKTIAITGTKGKTTTTYLIKSVLEQAGYKVGLIGTIEIIIGEKHIPAENTTPESLLTQKYLREMADIGIQVVVMETASQGFKLHRTAGIVFDFGIFTNLSPDHIGPGEHEDFAEYLACKRMLFSQCKQGFINVDSEYYPEVIFGHTCEITTYGIENNADLRGSEIELYRENGNLGVHFKVEGLLSFGASVASPGKFSVYNALAAILVCRFFDVPVPVIFKALRNVSVKGRIEMLPVADDFSLMIDYAHNAMSLLSLLKSLKEYQPGRLVCLFGCGGNRDKNRRIKMGEASGKLADLTIITSDNPRDEEPQDIINDIKSGIAKTNGEYVEIIDRSEAIAYALNNGRKGDIIVLAGKGHEDYQEIKGKKYPMDEREIVKKCLNAMQTSS